MSVYKRLNQARAHFHTLKLEKTGFNKFAGYKYFELGDFLIPALKTFDQCNLCAYISFSTDVATMKVIDMTDGTSFEITSPMSTAALKGCHEVQNLGAVQTYLRRYLWVAALEIVEHDALDATTGADKKAAPIVTATQGAMDSVDPETRAYLTDLAMECIELVKRQNTLGAWLRLERENLDDEQKTALWTLLDSKTRSAIKAAKPTNQPQKETA